MPLLDEHAERLDVVAWLKEVASGTHSRVVAFEDEGQRFRGRLIASALSQEAAERARDKARKKASKQQRTLKEETLFLAGWLLVFSSLPSPSWSDAQVLALSRARWQIELVIKRDARRCSSWRNCVAKRRPPMKPPSWPCWCVGPCSKSKPSGHERCSAKHSSSWSAWRLLRRTTRRPMRGQQSRGREP